MEGTWKDKGCYYAVGPSILLHPCHSMLEVGCVRYFVRHYLAPLSLYREAKSSLSLAASPQLATPADGERAAVTQFCRRMWLVPNRSAASLRTLNGISIISNLSIALRNLSVLSSTGVWCPGQDANGHPLKVIPSQGQHEDYVLFPF